MDYSEIKALVEKYWNGETSLEEESRLRIFFGAHSQDLPEELKEAAGLFLYFNEEGKHEMKDAGFDAVIQNMMRSSPKQEAAVIRFGKKMWKYAAVAIILLATGYFVVKQQLPANNRPALAEDTFTDPGKALAETKAALALVSANLNKGKEGIQKLALFDKAQQKVSNPAGE